MQGYQSAESVELVKALIQFLESHFQHLDTCKDTIGTQETVHLLIVARGGKLYKFIKQDFPIRQCRIVAQ